MKKTLFIAITLIAFACNQQTVKSQSVSKNSSSTTHSNV